MKHGTRHAHAKEVIQQAIEELDAVWEFDSARGLRDARGGPEYRNTSTAHQLRRLLIEDMARAELSFSVESSP